MDAPKARSDLAAVVVLGILGLVMIVAVALSMTTSIGIAADYAKSVPESKGAWLMNFLEAFGYSGGNS